MKDTQGNINASEGGNEKRHEHGKWALGVEKLGELAVFLHVFINLMGVDNQQNVLQSRYQKRLLKLHIIVLTEEPR